MVNENSNTCTCRCPMKPIQKEWLEFKVIKETMEFLFQHEMLENVAQQLISFNEASCKRPVCELINDLALNVKIKSNKKN